MNERDFLQLFRETIVKELADLNAESVRTNTRMEQYVKDLYTKMEKTGDEVLAETKRACAEKVKQCDEHFADLRKLREDKIAEDAAKREAQKNENADLMEAKAEHSLLKKRAIIIGGILAGFAAVIALIWKPLKVIFEAIFGG